MIYHIPVGTTIRRVQSTSKDPKYSECFVTDKEVYYTDKDLMKIEPENGTSSWAKNASHGPVYIFLLPLNAKPWWSFQIYEDAIHRIHFIGTTTSGARNEQEILQDLKSGKIDPFKTTPESKANNGTAEERIVGRVLTPRERAEIKEQWNNEDTHLSSRLNSPTDWITYKELKTVQTRSPVTGQWTKGQAWVKPLSRPIFPPISTDIAPRPKPDDPAAAIAWAIDREIVKELTHGLWNLDPIAPLDLMFYMDFKFGDKK